VSCFPFAYLQKISSREALCLSSKAISGAGVDAFLLPSPPLRLFLASVKVTESPMAQPISRTRRTNHICTHGRVPFIQTLPTISSVLQLFIQTINGKIVLIQVVAPNRRHNSNTKRNRNWPIHPCTCIEKVVMRSEIKICRCCCHHRQRKMMPKKMVVVTPWTPCHLCKVAAWLKE